MCFPYPEYCDRYYVIYTKKKKKEKNYPCTQIAYKWLNKTYAHMK